MGENGRFLILGGGIAGLSAAYRLLGKVGSPKNITIVESTARLGGWIRSKRYEDSTTFELGPRGLRPVGPGGRASLQLAHDLGLDDQVIAVSSSHVSAKNRYIFAHNELHKLPSGIGGILKSQSLLSKNLLPVLLKEPLVPKRKSRDDESIYDFISRRLNSEIADYIVDPMCRGIFAGDIKKLSIRSCLPMVYNLEENSGSIVKGLLLGKSPEMPKEANTLILKASKEKWSLWTLENGLSTLVEALENKLLDSGVTILKNTTLQSLTVKHNGTIETKIQNGDETFAADHLFSSISANRLAALLAKEHRVLAKLLKKITAVTVAVVNLEFEGSVLEIEGFGYLYPSRESPKVLGVIFDSCTFPQADRKSSQSTRLTVMLGGHFFEQQFGDPDKVDKEHIKKEATDALRKALGIQNEPSKVWVSIHKECIPQYHVGHSDLLQSIRNYVSEHSLPLTLIGSWYDGVGINDCVYHSQEAVDRLFMSI